LGLRTNDEAWKNLLTFWDDLSFRSVKYICPLQEEHPRDDGTAGKERLGDNEKHKHKQKRFVGSSLNAYPLFVPCCAKHMLGVAKVPDILKNKNLQQNRRTYVEQAGSRQ